MGPKIASEVFLDPRRRAVREFRAGHVHSRFGGVQFDYRIEGLDNGFVVRVVLAGEYRLSAFFGSACGFGQRGDQEVVVLDIRYAGVWIAEDFALVAVIDKPP
jgi:hypothetical protein